MKSSGKGEVPSCAKSTGSLTYGNLCGSNGSSLQAGVEVAGAWLWNFWALVFPLSGDV